MPGAIAQLVAFGKADAEWDRLFSNEVLGRKCAPGEEKRIANGLPNTNVLNNIHVKRNVIEANMGLPELVAYLGRLPIRERVDWIELVLQASTIGKASRDRQMPPEQ